MKPEYSKVFTYLKISKNTSMHLIYVTNRTKLLWAYVMILIENIVSYMTVYTTITKA